MSALIFLTVGVPIEETMLLGPSVLLVLYIWLGSDRIANMNLLVRIFGIVLLVGVQCLGIYRSVLKPLYDRSRPGSSYVHRWVSNFVIGCFQVLLQVVCAGPLQLLFLGQDPFGLITAIQWTIRNMEARRLNIRPPLFQVNTRGITIPLRDGKETAATLYSPRTANGTCDDETPRPVILIRTPYDKEGYAPWGPCFAERGYHYVVQDTRGRYGSEGDFFPMKNEADDGAATIEWLEKQPWCNGSVGMTGASYSGLAAFAAMQEQIGALKAVAPVLAATDVYNVMYGRGNSGAAHIELMFRWSHLTIHLMKKKFGMLEAIFTFFMGTGRALKNAYMHAPLKEADTKFLCPSCESLEWFQGSFDHPLGTEPFWQDKRKVVDVSQMPTVPPMLLIAGWYDIFCSDQLHDFIEFSRLNPQSRLVVGPYTHWHLVLFKPPKVARSVIDFFDRHLLNDLTSKELSPVEVFSMGHNMAWEQLESWPPPKCSTQKFVFAQENDNLMLLRMDTHHKKVNESEVSYTYDPLDPTPQIGGVTFNPTNCGRFAQNKMEESRDDILVFTSEPIVDQPMTIAGEIKVQLMVESNVEGTDYVARVCHVTPDNISQNIAEGIVRRFDLESGKRTRIEITLSPVMNRLAIGDRIRVHICSAAYPKYGRHLNTREPFHLEVEKNAMLSKQSLILGGTNGCHVIIPILS